jgi:hypothetical protein
MAGAWLTVPRNFECRGGELQWEYDGADLDCLKSFDPKREREALDRFIRLAEPEKGDRDIMEFVGLFGPLQLCGNHQLPRHHPLNPTSLLAAWEIRRHPDLDAKFRDKRAFNRRDFFCSPGGKPCPHPRSKTAFYYCEPTAAWRRLAVRATRLLEAATLLRSGRPPSAEFWTRVDGWSENLPELWPIHLQLTDPWYRLTDNVNWWLELGNVQPFLEYVDGGLRVGWRQDTAFALIGVQLMLAINRAENFGYLICAGCGLAKPRSRPPLAGKRVGPVMARRDYCYDCRRNGIPVRDAKRDQRRRDQINRLHGAGKSISQIARETGIEVSQIKETIAKARKAHG